MRSSPTTPSYRHVRSNLRQALFRLPKEHTKRPKTGKTLLQMKRMVIPENTFSTLPLPRMVSLQISRLNIKLRSTHTINKHYGEKRMPVTPYELIQINSCWRNTTYKSSMIKYTQQ